MDTTLTNLLTVILGSREAGQAEAVCKTHCWNVGPQDAPACGSTSLSGSGRTQGLMTGQAAGNTRKENANTEKGSILEALLQK